MKYLILIISLILVASCSHKKNKADEKIIVITPHPKMVISEYERAFNTYYKAKYGKTIEIESLDLGGTSDDLKFINSEYARNKKGINVDIMWGGGVTPFLTLKSAGYLTPVLVDSAIRDLIPKELGGMPVYDKDLTWFGAALSSFGFACNKALLKIKKINFPKTWQDLADPKYLGLIASADPRHSGSTSTIYAVILQAYGWEKGWSVILRMGANVRQFIGSSTGLIKSVIAGDSLCAIVIDYYAWENIADIGSDKLDFVLPEGLTVINPDAIGMLKGAPNERGAREFINFVLSTEGQELLMLPRGVPHGPVEKILGRLSVLPSLYTELKGKSIVPFNPFDKKNFIKYDAKEADLLWSVTNDMIGTLIVDSKNDMKASWEKVINSGLKKEAINTFTKVPVSKAKAEEFAAKWNDEIFRNQVINEWQGFNRQKFEKINKATSK
jgi:ABC-type Fe3+ transport system substrate-binding protein